MIKHNQLLCPLCGGELKYYDKVNRIVRTKKNMRYFIELRRLKCQICKSVHRELPDFLYPYKQYEAEIIIGVREGLITQDVIGFEDYPSEMTMKRWIRCAQLA